MDEKDLEKKRNYGEEYQKLLENQGYLFVNDPPAAVLADKRYTYEDYLNWPEDERVELIDGQIFVMSAPSRRHQELKRLLCQRFGIYLHGKDCEVFDAPFDVKIDFDIGKDSVVQPDILIVCDKTKFDEKGLNGAPDLAVEVLSPSNRSHDLVRKYNKYLEVGVREYWIVDPMKEEVQVNNLSIDKQQYLNKTYQKGDEIKVQILDNLVINVTDLFEGYKGKEIAEVEQRVFEIAKNLLRSGMQDALVASHANLSIKEIMQLKSEINV